MAGNSNNRYPRNNPYRKDPELHFDPIAFNALIAQHGIRVQIEKTSVCPNYKATVDSMQHDPNCTLCENGFVHYDPIECWAVFQQNALVRAFLKEGIFEPGQALISIPTIDDDGGQILVSYFDRITLLDQEERFYELLNKSDGDMDLLRYQALKVLYVMDRNGKEYKEGSHFKLSRDGNIVWEPGKPRPNGNPEEGIGEAFTVSYLFRPVYRVLELMHEGRYSQQLRSPGKQTIRFPQFALIKKDYYVTKKDVNGLPFKPPVEPQEIDHEIIETPLDY